MSGQPTFPEPLHVGRPNVIDRPSLFARIDSMLDRRWLSNHGPFSHELEERIAELAEANEAVVVANATVGLEVLAVSLGLEGEVVLPAWTFVGTAQALSWVGLTPVFCDVDPATHNLDPEAVERAITRRTSAILGVHLWGRPCDTERLEAVAAHHGVPLIFDAAHALACSHLGKAIGGFGTAEVFSLHATKVATACEGGVITTNDPDLARRLRIVRAFGFTAYDTVEELGTNAKLSELAAAFALTSLEHLDEFIAANRRNHAAYARCLEQVDGVRLLRHDGPDRRNFHYVVLEVQDSVGLTRDELVAVLHADNVLARRYFYPGCHRFPPYDRAGVELPVTDDLAGSVLVLPTGTAVSEAEVSTICSIVDVAMRNADVIRERLHG